MAKKREVTGTVTFENATLIFKNFSGEERRYNPPGKRNFCVIIPDMETADALAKDGWNVKMLKAKEEGEMDLPFLKVNVTFKGPRPPKVVMISSSGRTILDEDTIDSLDFADISEVDMIIRPFNWEDGNDYGVSAYLKTMFVTLEEDELEKKYARPQIQDDFEEDMPFE